MPNRIEKSSHGNEPFVAAEGAGVVILESLEHAEERNAEILAEIVFYETSDDAILMQPPQNGDRAYGLVVTVRDAALVASVLILALLVGAWYRQHIDIKVARFSSRHSAGKRESAAPIATSEPALAEKKVTTTATVQHPRSPRKQRTDEGAVVIVQPHDDLRGICLRYVGWYDARLVSKIRELNPELTDPNHITVGQHIVLPGSRTVGTATPESQQ